MDWNSMNNWVWYLSRRTWWIIQTLRGRKIFSPSNSQSLSLSSLSVCLSVSCLWCLCHYDSVFLCFCVLYFNENRSICFSLFAFLSLARPLCFYSLSFIRFIMMYFFYTMFWYVLKTIKDRRLFFMCFPNLSPVQFSYTSAHYFLAQHKIPGSCEPIIPI